MALRRIDLNRLVESLLRSEERYLTDPQAGPDEVRLRQAGLPHFTPSHLIRNLGREISGLSPRDVHRYAVPSRDEVLKYLTRERDRLISLVQLDRQGRYRSEETGRFLPSERGQALLDQVRTLNRVLDRVRRSSLPAAGNGRQVRTGKEGSAPQPRRGKRRRKRRAAAAV